LKIEHLESVADFPTEMAAFDAILQRVEEHNSVRLKLSAEIADSSNLIKTLVIRAEDARLLGNMSAMMKMYGQLQELNGELISEYKKRANNHAELLRCLKDVNQMIQKAARLRMGDMKNNVVAACRKAIKGNNIQALFKIIKLGGQSGSGA
jgi:Bardet-Biedl syndrome 2 protein